VAAAEVVGANPMEKRGQHHQNIETRLSPYMRQLPYRSQGFTGIAVIGPGFVREHDIVFEERPETGPVMTPHGPYIDEGIGALKNRVVQYSSIIHVYPVLS
jgi:hypothetical protein